MGEPAQIRGQTVSGRHDGAIHQHWDDGEAHPQGGLDLSVDEVARARQSRLALGRDGVEPVRSDDNQMDATGAQCTLDVLREVFPRRNVVHVLEDALAAEMLHEPIVDSPGYSHAISPTIRHEDLAHPCLATRVLWWRAHPLAPEAGIRRSRAAQCEPRTSTFRCQYAR